MWGREIETEKERVRGICVVKRVRLADLGELATDGTFGFEARFRRVLLVLVCTQAASATELLERLAWVHLGHNGTLHSRDVPGENTHIKPKLLQRRHTAKKCAAQLLTGTKTCHSQVSSYLNNQHCGSGCEQQWIRITGHTQTHPFKDAWGTSYKQLAITCCFRDPITYKHTHTLVCTCAAWKLFFHLSMSERCMITWKRLSKCMSRQHISQTQPSTAQGDMHTQTMNNEM